MSLNKNQSSPDDNRNLIIFMIITVILYFAYDTFIRQPHLEAVRAVKAVQAEQIALSAPDIDIQSSQAEPLAVNEVLKNETRLTIENKHVTGSINLTGGGIDYIALKDYLKAREKEDLVTVLAPKGTEFPRGIEYGWVSDDKLLELPSAKTVWSIKGDAKTLTPETPVTLSWTSPQNIEFQQVISLDKDFLITISQQAINRSNKQITLFPYGLISQQGIAPDFQDMNISHEGPISFVGGELEKMKYKTIRKEKRADFTATSGWAGVNEKYWLTALLPPQGQNVNYRFHYIGTPPVKGAKDTGRYQVDFTAAPITAAAGQTAAIESHVFVGPKRVLMLKEYSEKLGIDKLDLAVDFGIFWFFTIPFFYGLHYLAAMVGNVGVAIILLTLIIRTLASPLTYSSYKSFAKMKKVMPEVTALREKYGETNKAQLQKEMLELYSKEGVNPAAGCFPILLQIPIFFAFYKILFVTIEVRHAPFFGWIQDLSAPDPTSIFNLFGLIPWDPPSMLIIGVWPCLMLVGMQIQRRLNPPPTDPIQRDMAMYFPFIMTFVMSQFASGLVVYWTISAFFGIAQQMIIMRKMGVPIHLFGEEHPLAVPADKIIEGKAKVIKEKVTPIKDITPPKPRRKKKK